MSVDENLHDMIVSQNPERRGERRPTTEIDWELSQAAIHLSNAINACEPKKGHLLQAALQITKGVREAE